MRSINVISNGFQCDYEVGIVNGLQANGVEVRLLGSNATDIKRINAGVDFHNIRGDVSSSARFYQKVFRILRYWANISKAAKAYNGQIFLTIGLFTFKNPLLLLIEILILRSQLKNWHHVVHNVYPHGQNNFFVKSCYRLLYRFVDVPVCHTSKIADTVAYLAPNAQPFVMQHGFDSYIERESPSVSPPRYFEILEGRTGYFLFFGNVLPYKGLDVLIDAYSESPVSVPLLIAGKCDDINYREIIRKKILRSPASKDIHWIDRFIDTNEANQFLINCTAVVLPYRAIYQSGVIFSARAASKPIVFTDVGSLRDYYIRNFDQMAEFCTPESINDALVKFISRKSNFKSAPSFDSLLWSNTVKPYISAFK